MSDDEAPAPQPPGPPPYVWGALGLVVVIIFVIVAMALKPGPTGISYMPIEAVPKTPPPAPLPDVKPLAEP